MAHYILESTKRNVISHLTYLSGGGWGTDFFQGEFIKPQPDSNLYVTVESNSIKLYDYNEVDGVPLVSKLFLTALKETGVNNYQSFPVEIRLKSKEVKISNYYILNIIGKFICVNRNTSKFSVFGPSIARIQDLKLEVSNDTPPIFRANEYQEILFISDKIKQSIEQLGITGYEIRKADGWNDSHRF